MKVKFLPLASESLGVRSMCTYVETPDVSLLIDPGASLGPRFGLPPHPNEYRALIEARQRMAKRAETVNIVTISHYHFDHATPTFTDCIWNLSSLEVAKQLYSRKRVLAKNYRSKINASQRRRGWLLERQIKNFVWSFEAADGSSFDYDGTKLRFSIPVPHGESDSHLGWVLMLTIEYGGKKLTHASDIQGPMDSKTTEMILKEKPDLLYLGGPPTYLLKYRKYPTLLQQAWGNLERLVTQIPLVIVDHHLLREGWPESFESVLSAAADSGHRITSAAKFLGIEDSFLESQRKRLYENNPPSKEFMQWIKLREEKRRRTPVPL